jgi:type VI secretion system protein
MREERLLERISTWKREPGRREREDIGRITDSILCHLQRILNTRRGNVLIAADYGVPDFTDLFQAYPESVRDLEKSIRQTIQKYEPRLTGVRVSFIPQEEDILSLRFQIVAKLATTERKNQVLFETIIDTEGKISVQG